MSAPLRPIPGYELACPHADDLVEALRGVLGARDSQLALARALRELELEREDLAQLELEGLVALGETLAHQRGLSAVLGRSFAIRTRSYIELRKSTPIATGAPPP